MKKLGKISGPILVFGGVYSNLQALQAIQQKAEELTIPPSNIFCTGDIVAYCAQPAECIETIQEWGIHCITGNVELNLINQAEDCGCNFSEGSRCDVFSKQWYPYAQAQVTEEHQNFLGSIPHHLSFNYAGKKIVVVHGTYKEVSGYIFKSTPWKEKQEVFDQVQADIIISGHCGLPFYDFQKEQYWINAGVIGMPANDGLTSTWFCLLEEKDQQYIEVSFHHLIYDYLAAVNLMQAQQLLPTYAQTLQTGIWDNCDILPDIETSLQGGNINLPILRM